MDIICLDEVLWDISIINFNTDKMKNILIVLFFMMMVHNAIGQIYVEIDFGKDKPLQTHQVEWKEGMTALTALQYCTAIETKPIKDYIFVSDINGVKNTPFELVWYYEINDDKPKFLAYKQPIKNGDKIKWIYKKDTCSSQQETVTIEIRFGDKQQAKQTYQINWREDLTVMNALQHSVKIETYPFEDKYIFIKSIEGKKGVAKESFWACFINGEKAHKIAAMQLLNKGDYVILEFRQSNQRQEMPIYND